MRFELGFGKGVQPVEIDESCLLDVLLPNPVTKALTGEAEVRRALAEPIGAPLLREIVKPGEKIAIITSDITRPVPTWKIMPALLDELYAAGCKAEDLLLVFALGSHRAQSVEEQRHLAGERAWAEIRCVDSDGRDCVHLGVTKNGTPVDIFRPVAEADKVICIGNIEYHYFAGYSGGAKAVMPGVSTREAIQANHSRMVKPEACAGRLEGNPVREDIEEAASMLGIDFIVNVVLDEHKEIIRAFAGDVTKAHRAGCAFLDTLYSKPIDRRADIVIVSQGGAPKDLNLYQTQKALDNAKHAVRDGGIIILVGSCREGLGEKTFEQWLTSAPSPHSLVERIEREFKLGGHKAAAIAMVQERADIYLVSEMDPDFVRSLFMAPFASVEKAYAAAKEKLGEYAAVILMPYGGSTLPKDTATSI
ncbi:MAG: nickel-dependent lactate racemase [Oscillospiraceae bacterium]|nr:nickel-dependent lactate racemase [Oscillospiraceae bacterium]